MEIKIKNVKVSKSSVIEDSYHIELETTVGDIGINIQEICNHVWIQLFTRRIIEPNTKSFPNFKQVKDEKRTSTSLCVFKDRSVLTL